MQLDLFGAVLATYLDGEPRSNESLYRNLVESGHLRESDLQAKVPVGRAGAPVSLAKRRVRWYQQTLRGMGVLERVPGVRGTWRLAERDKNDLTKAPPSVVMLGFSTELGVALWGSCFDVFNSLSESIAVCITSPPYALARPRAYGNPSQSEWVDFVCRSLEPIIKQLAPGGSIALNLSNDIFVPGSPARSLINERLTIAMEERFGMHLMDRVIWHNNSKPPGPVQWASRRRMQLNTGYEPVFIFCNDPMKSFADNRRVLEPHTESHQRLIESGGERRVRVNSDGAHRIRVGSYSNPTPGRIPKNVLSIGSACADQRRMRRLAREAGLPVHGASMPLALAMLLVKYLSRPGDLVVDPFGGTMTTARARGVTDDDELELLAAAGHDLPGAVEVTPAHAVPHDVLELHVTLSLEPLEPATVAAPVDDGFSVPGIQEKFSAVHDGRRYTMRRHGASGDFIAKLPSAKFPDLVLNEGVCFQLAQAVGIRTAGAEVRPIEELDVPGRVRDEFREFLLVPRFDRRKLADGSTGRVHFEELAQALGVEPRRKYQRIADAMRALLVILKSSEAPQEDFDDFFRRWTAYALMGNTDAHLKNWGLIYPDGCSARLAPAYDMVCVAAYFDDVGEADFVVNRQMDVSLRRWSEDVAEQMAKSAGLLTFNRARRIVRDTRLEAAARWPVILRDLAPQRVRETILQRLATLVPHAAKPRAPKHRL